jgi:hypothetical protein
VHRLWIPIGTANIAPPIDIAPAVRPMFTGTDLSVFKSLLSASAQLVEFARRFLGGKTKGEPDGDQ